MAESSTILQTADDEAVVLNRLMTNQDWDLAERFGVTPEWFPVYKKVARALWRARNSGLGADPLAVTKVDPDLTLPYLLNLDYDFTGDITPCLLRLQKHYREKKIKELAVHLKSKPQKASEIIERLNELTAVPTNGEFHRPMTQLYKEYLESFNSPKEDFFHEWNLKSLTDVTGGIEKGKTYVLGGLKKSGKSKFFIDLLVNCVNNKIGVLFLSLEMGAKSVFQWILSRLVEIDSLKIKLRELTELELAIVKEAQWWFKENEKLITVNTRPGLTVDEVCYEIEKTDKEIILLDFLQRMTYNGSENYATQISKGVARMADATKRANKSAIFICQVSNDAEGKLANVGHLRDSGGIAEGVDCIIVWNNMARIRHEDNPKPLIYLNVEQRDGPRKRLKVRGDLRIGKFEDLI